MNNNGPVAVSADGTSLANASGKNVIFNTKYPFHKLDSTNPVSFQVLQIFLSKETPMPVAGSNSSTLVYSFPHNYTYVPSTWFLMSLDNFNTTLGGEGSIISGSNQVSTSYCTMDVRVDATNVNFYVTKYYPALAPTPPTNIGVTIYVRSYVFVEDLTGTDISTGI